MTLQLFNDDGSSTMTMPNGKVVKYSEWDNWVIDGIARDYLRSKEAYRPLLPHELAEVFPQGKPILNNRVKEIKRKLGELLEDDTKTNMEMQTNYSKKDEHEFHLHTTEQIRQRLLKEKTECEGILMFMGGKGTKKREAAQDFTIAVLKAKAFPIEDLIPFKGKKTPCLWHEDRDPSLHYYKKNNRVHCFVCDQGWDAIDVVMKQRGCDFREAVNIINNT